MKQIDLECIFRDIENYDLVRNKDLPIILNAMKEACRQTLELAAENAEMNNITFDSEERFSLNGKRIILDTINQIK